MQEDHLRFLVCPKCKGVLYLSETKTILADSIDSGKIICTQCSSDFPIIRHIPRFVPLDNYASNFGFEWLKHAKTQYDSYSGANVSEKRFFEETKWPRDLIGQHILEIGSGSGRFTEHAAATGGMVISMDYSYAVEANYASNGTKSNILIVQADLYNMPFRENFFDRLFCFGVLQHTPDVKKAFSLLPCYLKSDGDIAVDVYPKVRGIIGLLITKYWVRPVTKRMNPQLLYWIVSNYVRLMWPISRVIHILPHGRYINRALLIADYRGKYDLREDILKEWAILDTFDMLSPAHDHPQTIESVRKWFEDAHLLNIDVHYGYNGIEGRAKKP